MPTKNILFPFLYHMLDRPVNSKKNGFHLGYGWCGGPCRWGTKLKTLSLDGVALDAGIHYVGIAADEPDRLARLEAPKCSPRWKPFFLEFTGLSSILYKNGTPGFTSVNRMPRCARTGLIRSRISYIV